MAKTIKTPKIIIIFVSPSVTYRSKILLTSLGRQKQFLSPVVINFLVFNINIRMMVFQAIDYNIINFFNMCCSLTAISITGKNVFVFHSLPAKTVIPTTVTVNFLIYNIKKKQMNCLLNMEK